jgi:radical SAM protein with 4Fe4S-binding SPASM domain
MGRPIRALPLIQPAPRRPAALGEVRDVDREARPYYVVWEITLRCDLACRHCGSRAGKPRDDELGTEEALDLVDQLAAMGTREISLIGGEAYLRDDWLTLVRRIRGHGIDCGVVTGGRGLTLERARAAKEAGVQAMSVSIDGLRESHDDLRALAGSHAAAMAALENLRLAGLRRSANTQINRRNLTEIPAVFESLVPTGIHAWQVQFTVAMGRAADHPETLLQPYQMLELMPMLARLDARCRDAGVRLWPGNNIGYFGPYESVLRGEMSRGHLEPCGAGRVTLGIEANGDIKGCPSLPSADYVGGNVRERPLREIWERAEALRFTRGRTVDDLRGYCRSCYYAEDCLGGCTWTSHVLFGARGDNPYCHHRALELLGQGKRERLVLAERAPGVPFDHGRFELVLEDWPSFEIEAARRIARSGEGSLAESELSPAEGAPLYDGSS